MEFIMKISSIFTEPVKLICSAESSKTNKIISIIAMVIISAIPFASIGYFFAFYYEIQSRNKNIVIKNDKKEDEKTVNIGVNTLSEKENNNFDVNASKPTEEIKKIDQESNVSGDIKKMASEEIMLNEPKKPLEMPFYCNLLGEKDLKPFQIFLKNEFPNMLPLRDKNEKNESLILLVQDLDGRSDFTGYTKRVSELREKHGDKVKIGLLLVSTNPGANLFFSDDEKIKERAGKEGIDFVYTLLLDVRDKLSKDKRNNIIGFKKLIADQLRSS